MLLEIHTCNKHNRRHIYIYIYQYQKIYSPFIFFVFFRETPRKWMDHDGFDKR